MPSTYRLSVLVDGRWVELHVIEADSHPEALRKAIACLAPEHYDKPISVVTDPPDPPAEQT